MILLTKVFQFASAGGKLTLPWIQLVGDPDVVADSRRGAIIAPAFDTGEAPNAG